MQQIETKSVNSDGFDLAQPLYVQVALGDLAAQCGKLRVVRMQQDLQRGVEARHRAASATVDEKRGLSVFGAKPICCPRVRAYPRKVNKAGGAALTRSPLCVACLRWKETSRLL